MGRGSSPQVQYTCSGGPTQQHLPCCQVFWASLGQGVLVYWLPILRDDLIKGVKLFISGQLELGKRMPGALIMCTPSITRAGRTLRGGDRFSLINTVIFRTLCAQNRHPCFLKFKANYKVRTNTLAQGFSWTKVTHLKTNEGHISPDFI